MKIYFGNRKIVLTDKINKLFKKDHCTIIKTEDGSLPNGIIEWFKTSEETPLLYIVTDEIENAYKQLTNNFVMINAAGGLVANQDGEILCIFRRGLWDLPKGKAEKGEKSDTTALREVCEECGIKDKDLNITSFITYSYHTYKLNDQWILKRTAWYSMSYNGTDSLSPQTEEDITELSWVKKHHLKQLFKENGYDSIKGVVKRFLNQSED